MMVVLQNSEALSNFVKYFIELCDIATPVNSGKYYTKTYRKRKEPL